MKQSDRLSYRVLLPAIFSLAWPTMLENALGTAVQYVDTAMVGSLGTEATAAVGATATVSWLIGSSVSALGIGFLAFISQALGAGEKEKAAGAAGQAALVVLLLGSFFTLLCLVLSPFVPIWMQVDTSIRDLTAVYFGILYAPMLFRCSMIIFGTVLRSAGDTRTPMKTGILVNLINVVLNFLLIYPTRTLSLGGITVPVPGAGLEVVGAALASAVSFVAGGILMFRAVWRHPVISPRGYSLKPDKAIMLPALKVAVPNMLQRM